MSMAGGVQDTVHNMIPVSLRLAEAEETVGQASWS